MTEWVRPRWQGSVSTDAELYPLWQVWPVQCSVMPFRPGDHRDQQLPRPPAVEQVPAPGVRTGSEREEFDFEQPHVCCWAARQKDETASILHSTTTEVIPATSAGIDCQYPEISFQVWALRAL